MTTSKFSHARNIATPPSICIPPPPPPPIGTCPTTYPPSLSAHAEIQWDTPNNFCNLHIDWTIPKVEEVHYRAFGGTANPIQGLITVTPLAIGITFNLETCLVMIAFNWIYRDLMNSLYVQDAWNEYIYVRGLPIILSGEGMLTGPFPGHASFNAN